ncbi:MAG TPA: glycoside hydrolase family 2 TIM barrel-domain containing protein [Opitutaceae bacterium]|nr:glycoside hydrolase family 2 TIM barrel-domain containing protein [Opitutaceae bacterium]
MNLKLLFMLCAFTTGRLIIAGAAEVRVVKTINRDWAFQYFPNQQPDLAPAAPNYDDSKWPAVAIPHTWSTFETTRDVHPFIKWATERDDSYWWYGWGWYRKHFTVGPQFNGRVLSLEFDGVQKYSKIYLNGALIAEHKGGYTSFSVDIARFIHFDQDNVLVVQVSNRRDDPYGAIPPMTAGNFDVYGGIYRDVRLVIADPLHIPFQGSADHEGGTFVTTPEINEERGAVRVRTWVQNDFSAPKMCTLVTTVVDAEGKAVAQTSSQQTIEPGKIYEFDQPVGTVSKPHLWSSDSPYLYQVHTEVREGDRLADTYTSPLGFRWFEWDYKENRLYLNGKKVLLRGINRHQEFPWLGDAMPKWMHRKDLEDIRYNMGLNFQRTVHYPNDPYVYNECDRLGFMLIEEAPNIKDIAFGKAVQEQNMKEMIRRDRNHPSILIWSMGNETNQPADSAWAAAEDTTRIIYMRRSDNGGNYIQLTDKNLPIENLLRCTTRGWYNEDDHDFGVETGHPDGSQVTGTEEWQHQRDATSDKLLNSNVVVWLYADHGADRVYLNSPLKHINPKGWVDAYRFPKFAYYLWQANFTKKPMAFIHPTYWRERYIGQRHDILVDSNCDEVTLKFDGQTIGKQIPADANSHCVMFKDVEVKKGTLTAEAKNGDQVVTCSLILAGKPARLVLKAYPDKIPADRTGISVISADIVDADGVHVYGANPPLTWTLSGPGILVGPGTYETDTAKNSSMEGTMYIDAPVANVVRSRTDAGQIRVKISAPGLEPAQVTIEATTPANDAVLGIAEPALVDEGRAAVQRDSNFKPVVLTAKVTRINEIDKDYDFSATTKEGYRQRVEEFVRQKNPTIDPFSAEYRAFIERITQIVLERNGHLVADDYNFNARSLNDKKKTKTKSK